MQQQQVVATTAPPMVYTPEIITTPVTLMPLPTMGQFTNFTNMQRIPLVPNLPVKTTYEINYCDTREFPDNRLAELSLARIDYFIYNTSCSSQFFQCSIGQTFVLTCPSDDQAFDPAISSYNFKNSVRICPQYDHVLHCTIRDTCTPLQFACCAQPQMCIELSRRCDGHRDCADGDDENNCPSCARNEFACVQSGKCIPAKQRCDGKPDDCGDGTNLDEIGCSKNETCWGKFVCDSQQTLLAAGHSECIDIERHCDGKRDCPGGEDEMHCRMNDAKYLLCENQKQSVTKAQWCNGKEECLD
ncbi:CRE-LRX-1 protein, partial [Aphelenchoides avenae]